MIRVGFRSPIPNLYQPRPFRLPTIRSFAMSVGKEYGFLLPNGSRVVHGSGVQVRSAFPPELNIPGTLHMFGVGNSGDASTPPFRGPTGFFPFDTTMRMPRHVHMSTGPGTNGTSSRVYAVSGEGLPSWPARCM